MTNSNFNGTGNNHYGIPRGTIGYIPVSTPNGNTGYIPVSIPRGMIAGLPVGVPHGLIGIIPTSNNSNILPNVSIPRSIPDVRDRLPNIPSIPEIQDRLPNIPNLPGIPGSRTSPADILCWEDPISGETICGASGGGGSGGGMPSIPSIPDIRERLPNVPSVPSIPDIRERLPNVPSVPSVPDIRERLPNAPTVPTIPQRQPTIPIPSVPDIRERLPDIPTIPEIIERLPVPPLGQQPSITRWPNVSPLPKPAGWTQDKANRIVIGLVSGLFGHASVLGNEAVKEFRDFLRYYLQEMVNPENIFYLEWNPGSEDDPFQVPDITLHNLKIDRASSNPCYLALIGYSYGGWAVSRLSRRTRRIPDFIGLIDPVYGPENNIGPNDLPRGRIIKNWYQNHAIQETDPCSGLRVSCSSPANGIACGNSLSNIQRQNVQSVNEAFIRNWDGDRERINCAFKGRVPINSTHANITGNKWIWRQIADQIVSDITRIQC